MTQEQNEKILKELTEIYDSRNKWVAFGKEIKSKVSDISKENPKLITLVRLGIAANIGIWLSFIFNILDK